MLSYPIEPIIETTGSNGGTLAPDGPSTSRPAPHDVYAYSASANFWQISKPNHPAGGAPLTFDFTLHGTANRSKETYTSLQGPR